MMSFARSNKLYSRHRGKNKIFVTGRSQPDNSGATDRYHLSFYIDMTTAQSLKKMRSI